MKLLWRVMFNKLLPYILTAALAVFAYMGLQLHNASVNAQVLTNQVDSLTSKLDAKQLEVNTLANAVDQTAFVNRQLLAERQIIANIRAAADAEKAKLRTELAAATSAVSELRKSEDEHVKKWANTLVPGDAVRLLKYATQGGSSNSDGGESDLPDSTGRVVAAIYPNHSF